MAKKAQDQTYDAYDQSLKYWMDAVNYWTKPWENMSDLTKNFKSSNVFDNYRSWLDKLTDMNKNLPENMRNLYGAFVPAKDFNENFTKTVKNYEKLINSITENMGELTQKGYVISEKTLKGEDVETDSFFDEIKKAYENITTNFVESLEDTPFAGIKEVDKAMKKSFETFSYEQKMARTIAKEMIALNSKLSKLSTDALKDTADTLKDIEDKETVSLDTMKQVLEVYADTMKKAAEAVDMPPSVIPEYKVSIDDATKLAKTQLDVLASGLEIYIKTQRAITKSSSDLFKFTEKSVKDGKMDPDFYKEWAETYKKSLQDIVDKSQLFNSVPKFIMLYSDCLKQANSQLKQMLTRPLSYIEDLEKIKNMVEKQSKKKPEATAD